MKRNDIYSMYMMNIHWMWLEDLVCENDLGAKIYNDEQKKKTKSRLFIIIIVIYECV